MSDEMINEMKERGFYGFVSKYGHELSRDELITLLKEFNYAVYDISKSVEEKAIELMIDEIKERI